MCWYCILLSSPWKKALVLCQKTPCCVKKYYAIYGSYDCIWILHFQVSLCELQATFEVVLKVELVLATLAAKLA